MDDKLTKCVARALFPAFLLVGSITLTGASAEWNPYQGMGEQFVIDLPAGWSVFNQQEIYTGEPGTHGFAAFCSEKMSIEQAASGDEEVTRKLMSQLAGVETGAVPGFLLDRLPAKKGMSCTGFDKKAEKKVVKLMGTDPMFGPGRTVQEAPHAEPVTLGDCQGLRLKGKGGARGGGGKILDVFAVSDGETLFLFKLLNLEEHYEQNVGLFEEVVATVRMTR